MYLGSAIGNKMPSSKERSVPLCGDHFDEVVGRIKARYVKKLELCDSKDP